jgi:hypothetical protein
MDHIHHFARLLFADVCAEALTKFEKFLLKLHPSQQILMKKMINSAIVLMTVEL